MEAQYRKHTLSEVGVNPETQYAIADAIEKASRILEKIDERWPGIQDHVSVDPS